AEFPNSLERTEVSCQRAAAKRALRGGGNAEQIYSRQIQEVEQLGFQLPAGSEQGKLVEYRARCRFEHAPKSPGLGNPSFANRRCLTAFLLRDAGFILVDRLLKRVRIGGVRTDLLLNGGREGRIFQKLEHPFPDTDFPKCFKVQLDDEFARDQAGM